MVSEKKFIFGYGSLINRDSRSITCETGKTFIVRLKNFRRAWEARILEGGVTSVGISRCEGESCNGVLFEISSADLDKMDLRETSTYERIKINKDDLIIEDKSEREELSSADFFAYVTKYPFEPNKEFPIIMSYIEVILTGCISIGEEFTKEFLDKTYDWRFIEDDFKTPRYPRALKEPLFRKEIIKLIGEKR